ncbi:MAG: SAM-dependent DNA methyltransferase, partial [Proteobacteria bacterium]
LVFTKGGRTDEVWFYDVHADGFSLDDKRTPHPDKNDLPDMVARWSKRNPKEKSDPTQNHFFVSVADIRENKYDLSHNRYNQTKFKESTYDPPKIILTRMRKLEKDILNDIDELEELLG